MPFSNRGGCAVTYFITPEYMWSISAEMLLVIGVALRLIVQIANRAAADKFARATAGLALFFAALLLWYTFPASANEVLSRQLSADVPGWIGKGMLLLSALAALRATMTTEQPQLFLATVAAMLLAASNDLTTAWIALECLLLAALARPATRVWSALFMCATAVFLCRYGVTELSALSTLTTRAADILWLATPPVVMTFVFVAYLFRPQGRFLALVFFAILVFVVRYVSVVLIGGEIARKLGFLV